jgi:hypothetical protein
VINKCMVSHSFLWETDETFLIPVGWRILGRKVRQSNIYLWPSTNHESSS